MKYFIEGEDRNQRTLFTGCLDDYIAENNPVSVIDVFIDELAIRAQYSCRLEREAQCNVELM